MPSRRLAFIGTLLEGPAVSIAGIKNPVLRVRGLPVGSSVQANGVHYISDGNYPLDEADWLRVSTPKICRTLICDVISTKAA